jgi:rhodanese-related sulfurtransferase
MIKPANDRQIAVGRVQWHDGFAHDATCRFGGPRGNACPFTTPMGIIGVPQCRHRYTLSDVVTHQCTLFFINPQGYLRLRVRKSISTSLIDRSGILKRRSLFQFNIFQKAKVALATWLCVVAPCVLADSEKLQSVHLWIEQKYPAVDHVDSDEYLRQVAGSSELVLFDVRTPEEYAVSHLEGAIQVDPEIDKDAFFQQYSKGLAGKTVVFYCSVGRRSSLLVDAVSNALIDAGSGDIYNLKNGIFGWHNDNKPLIWKNGSTEYVHPYSWRWKRYLERKDLAKYKIDQAQGIPPQPVSTPSPFKVSPITA